MDFIDFDEPNISFGAALRQNVIYLIFIIYHDFKILFIE